MLLHRRKITFSIRDRLLRNVWFRYLFLSLLFDIDKAFDLLNFCTLFSIIRVWLRYLYVNLLFVFLFHGSIRNFCIRDNLRVLGQMLTGLLVFQFLLQCTHLLLRFELALDTCLALPTLCGKLCLALLQELQIL